MPLSIEDIILQSSSRGMERLRDCLPADFCRRTARQLYALERRQVLLTTGFYVGGRPETDGPPGTVFLAKALAHLGFACTVVTDRLCKGLSEAAGVPVSYVCAADGEAVYADLLDRYRPVALIALERCGVNACGDYANMRGESIAAHTAKLDWLFEEGRRRGIMTVGIGDGGNEIGMGNFREAIERRLSLLPCVTKVDCPMIATVSNWGGYGLCACLQRLSGKRVLPSPAETEAYLRDIVRMGCVDGVTKRQETTVDGFPEGTESDVIRQLELLE